jgi:hypothetical protein
MARVARTVKPALSDAPVDKLAACLNYAAKPADAAQHPYFDACAQWFNSLSADDKETALTVIDCIASAHKDIAESIAATLPPAPKCPLRSPR